MVDYDFPRVSGARTGNRRIALDLGQVELDYPWKLPASMDSGTTTRTSSVHNGESFDPAILSVHVYEDMRFYDRLLGEDGEWLTVEGFRFHVHDSDDMPDYAWYVDFQEDAPEGAEPTDSRYGLNAERFARLVLKKTLVLRSGVENYADRGVPWAERA